VFRKAFPDLTEREQFYYTLYEADKLIAMEGPRYFGIKSPRKHVYGGLFVTDQWIEIPNDAGIVDDFLISRYFRHHHGDDSIGLDPNAVMLFTPNLDFGDNWWVKFGRTRRSEDLISQYFPELDKVGRNIMEREVNQEVADLVRSELPDMYRFFVLSDVFKRIIGSLTRDPKSIPDYLSGLESKFRGSDFECCLGDLFNRGCLLGLVDNDPQLVADLLVYDNRHFIESTLRGERPFIYGKRSMKHRSVVDIYGMMERGEIKPALIDSLYGTRI
jgi:hypothetical protein